MGKRAEDLFIEDGEYKPPALRGALEKWLDRDWTLVGDEEHTIKWRQDQGKAISAFREFESWLNRRVEDDWYGDIKDNYGNDRPKEIFFQYWEDNDEFRRRVESHMQEVTLAGTPGTNASGDDDSDDSGDDEEESHKDQSSFGASQYPELFDIGVVNESGNLVQSKLRGLVIAFSKDVDVIKGETTNFDIIWAQRAFLKWGFDRWDQEWIDVVTNHIHTNDFYEAVEFCYNKRDGVSERFHEKFEGGCELGVGKVTTDDLSKAFLDSEVPGWDEDEEEEDDHSSKSKWEEYEEKASELDTKDKDGGNSDGKREQKGRWEKFESKSEANSAGERTTTDGDDGSGTDSSRAPVSSGSDGGSGNPDTLGGWAEKEGTAESVDRKEIKKNGNLDASDNGEAKANSNSNDSVSSGSSGSNGTNSPDKQQRNVADRDTREYEIKWPDVEPIDEFERNRIYEGNTFEWALKLPENSVDTIVTSPPYYNLRDYDIEDAYPISGDWTCDHNWVDEFCTKCGAFLGQLGAEPDPAVFIDHIIDLMERYKRVLKPTGSLWLNIGDTYAGKNIDGRVKAKRKSRMMVPERIYQRMVQSGWVLRDYVIWAKKVWMPDDDLKGNGKPFAGESRIADQWEPMVHFTVESDHYSDVNSNRLLPPSFDGDMGEEGIEGKFRKGEDTQRGKTYHSMGTNPPDVWLINSDGYQGDHRAVYPEELPKRCIKLSTPDRVCGECGVPYEKEVHVESEDTVSPGGDYATYEQQCSCDADHKPGVAFDPFLGSGTTAVAAANNGFDWAGVELSEKYQELARDRIPTGRQIGLDQW